MEWKYRRTITAMPAGQSIIICGRKEEESEETSSILEVFSRISSQKVKVGEFKWLKWLGYVSGLLGTLRTDSLFPVKGVFLVHKVLLKNPFNYHYAWISGLVGLYQTIKIKVLFLPSKQKHISIHSNTIILLQTYFFLGLLTQYNRL